MVDGKQGTMVIGIPLQKKPSNSDSNQVKRDRNRLQIHRLQILASKQSIAVEAGVVTATGAIQGAAIGALMGTLSGATAVPRPPGSAHSPQALASLQQAQALAGGRLVQTRNFAVMSGLNAGSVMKRIRGKEDVESR